MSERLAALEAENARLMDRFTDELDRLADRLLQGAIDQAFEFLNLIQPPGRITLPLSYGIDLRANFRRAADFVHKILKGTKPGDLPVELPTKFELIVNMKTAKALGLAIPETFLVRADEVIE
jgi:ABC transporter substrate binding protein